MVVGLMGITIHYKTFFDGCEECLVDALNELAAKFAKANLGVDISPVIRSGPMLANIRDRDPFNKLVKEVHAKYPDLGEGRTSWFLNLGIPFGDEKCLQVIGISVVIMNGCEPFNLPFYEYEQGKWKVACFTKTQWADDFVKAHLTVCTLLDIMKQSGFKIKVSDEADYYKTRDLKVLNKNMNEMSAFINFVGNGLKKAFEGTDLKLVTPKDDI
jgi:hypothetical protein